jgi:hypothetical protein
VKIISFLILTTLSGQWGTNWKYSYNFISDLFFIFKYTATIEEIVAMSG